MRWRTEQAQNGQAAVESAIVLPLMVFILLGVLQLSIAYQARLLSEYAAFKVARAASVYRVDCGRMVKAGLMALIPSMSRSGRDSPQQRYVRLARQVLNDNHPPGLPYLAGGNVPLVQVDYRVSDFRDTFDEQLEVDERPMKVHVRLAYFYEYRIPFAGWIISRVWLAAQTGRPWTRGADPVMPVKRQADVVERSAQPSPDWAVVERAIDQKYFTVPIVATWSMRMMSDPIPGRDLQGQCR
jgi:hypothetical protein